MIYKRVNIVFFVLIYRINLEIEYRRFNYDCKIEWKFINIDDIKVKE